MEETKRSIRQITKDLHTVFESPGYQEASINVAKAKYIAAKNRMLDEEKLLNAARAEQAKLQTQANVLQAELFSVLAVVKTEINPDNVSDFDSRNDIEETEVTEPIKLSKEEIIKAFDFIIKDLNAGVV